MTRELLKAAAKAADYTLGRHAQDEWKFTLGGKEWNPLKSNHDALQLVVDLQLNLGIDEEIDFDGTKGVEAWRVQNGKIYLGQAPHSGDLAADLRKAITLCAAKIGGYKE